MRSLLPAIVSRIVLLVCFSHSCLKAQDTIYLKNPSFEDKPRVGAFIYNLTPIKGWMDCGVSLFPEESQPDLFSSEINGWGANMEAADGKTYLSLVARYNDTWESISQRLERELEPGRCYAMSAFLALSPVYSSQTARSRVTPENFATPVTLRIWGGDKKCNKKILLATSSPVANHEWMEFEFRFAPQTRCTWIVIEAYYDTSVSYPYNGQVLVDRLSPITIVDCDK